MCLSDADMLLLFLSPSLVFIGLDGEAVDELSSRFSFYAQIGREREGQRMKERTSARFRGWGGYRWWGGDDKREVGRDAATLGGEDTSL